MTDAEQQELALALPEQKPGSESTGSERRKLPRSSKDFPRDPSGLDRDKLEQHYLEMRASHVFLSRSRGQLKRRYRDEKTSLADLKVVLQNYEAKLMTIGQEKAELLTEAMEVRRKIQAFEDKQEALDKLLDDFEQTNEEAGFWSIIRVKELVNQIRQLVRLRRLP